ncbi:sulfatase-like hydrolase/transferase [Novipirellula maiorica]|uniref:sulfatase-like hydrolase/transferase n=1 Tax=Novipirellula maiorica TaxID=1265734 RepID=UPI001EEE4663|nr:sulfatase-like hydrolase/transferase [Rhodopirellula maiorica]
MSCSSNAGAAKPNFLFIIADDCTFRDIGCYGGQAKTPNIDRLASQGVRMKRCFQAAPMCSPTRHNIYTGLYPVKSGAYPNHTFIKDGVQSVVHHLKPLGYRVALSGKRHISPEEAFPFEYSGKKNPDMNAIKNLFQESSESRTPFCQFICSNEPHAPWNKGDASAYPPADVKLPPYFVDTPKTREEFSKYLAEITYYDDQVGQVLALLKKHNLENNTVVMVVSEQGNSFPFAKWTCYDHGLQSAMIVRWPGKVAAGSQSNAMVEYVDVLPTFLEAAGGDIPDVLDGKSMLGVLTGKTDHHKNYVFGIQTSRGIFAGPDHYGIRSVRSSQLKLIHNLDPDARFYNSIDKKEFFREWKTMAAEDDAHATALVNRYYNRPEFELYDIVADPLEQNNLAADPKYASEISSLKSQLAQWMKSQGDLGQDTEMAAIDRMNTGNEMVKQARGKDTGSKKKKKKNGSGPKRGNPKNTPASTERVESAHSVNTHINRASGMNVLFIVIDDLCNYPTIMQNYPGVKTPAFEAFAKTSLQFTRAYSPGTMCNPSRSAILSGIAPYRSGLYTNGQQWQDSPLLSSVKTLPQAFRDSGYHTAGCGKLYHSRPSVAQWQAQWDDDAGGEGKFAPRAKPSPIPDSVGGPANFTYGAIDESEVSDFQITKFTKSRLAAQYDRPFFVAHGIRYPHNPWTVPQRFIDLYPADSYSFPPPGYKSDDLNDLPAVGKQYARKGPDRKALADSGHWEPTIRHYLACISAADELFGDLIASLDASPHKDNTIVVVWADHGFHMGEKDHFAKYALWEQTTNVMLMVRVPGMTSGGTVCERTVSLQDLYPTLVQLCGLNDPGHKLDGRSVVPLLKNPSQDWPHSALTTHMKNDFALRNETHRYIRYHDGSEELYDHTSDPFEWNNKLHAANSRKVIAELSSQLPAESVDPLKSGNRKANRNMRRQER